MAPLGSPSNHRAHEQARRTNLWQRSAGARAFTPRGSTADHRTVCRRPAGDHQETPPTLELKARASVGGQVMIDRSKTRACLSNLAALLASLTTLQPSRMIYMSILGSGGLPRWKTGDEGRIMVR